MGGDRLSLEDFRAFWRGEQDGSIEEATAMFGLVASSSTLSLPEFQRLMLSDHNSALDPIHRVVHQDMTRPLTDYYICSSHNTFLVGNQFTSDSSDNMYRRALLMGCRSVHIISFTTCCLILASASR